MPRWAETGDGRTGFDLCWSEARRGFLVCPGRGPMSPEGVVRGPGDRAPSTTNRDSRPCEPAPRPPPERAGQHEGRGTAIGRHTPEGHRRLRTLGPFRPSCRRRSLLLISSVYSIPAPRKAAPCACPESESKRHESLHPPLPRPLLERARSARHEPRRAATGGCGPTATITFRTGAPPQWFGLSEGLVGPTLTCRADVRRGPMPPRPSRPHS